MTSPIRYGWLGDDFTGATDTLATVAERGWRALLFLGVPDESTLARAGTLDAVGLVGATRTFGVAEVEEQVGAAGRFFAAAGCEVLHYKCCSTFDSAPGTGNLAVAARALAVHAGGGPTLVVGGQPPLGRYCAFSNLFAAGEGRVHRLDRHPVMAHHPATPMQEADLLRHFAALGAARAEALTWLELEAQEADAIAVSIAARIAASEADVVILDALRQEHVERIGALLRAVPRPVAVLGASSVAEAWFAPRAHAMCPAPVPDRPVLALAGSLSPLSRRQAAAARRYETLPIGPGTLASQAERDALVQAAARHLGAGRDVQLSAAGAGPDGPRRSVPGFAAACGRLVDDVLARTPVRRLAVAGGDTSSAVAQGIDLWGLTFDRRFGPGICVCRTRSARPERDGMQLLLKGGQLGAETLFDDFASAGTMPAA